jgi:hypothetical protein
MPVAEPLVLKPFEVAVPGVVVTEWLAVAGPEVVATERLAVAGPEQ